MGGYDIGAFQLCLKGPPIAPMPCIVSAGYQQFETLTVQASPAAGGTTTPVPGAYNEPLDSVIPLTPTTCCISRAGGPQRRQRHQRRQRRHSVE